MKIRNSYKIFSLLMMLLLSSCLSTVSETTCGDGEAYDAEDRNCVPTIAEGPNTIFIASSAPISSAYVSTLTGTSQSHSITISNQYNNDFSIRWTLYSPGGGSAVVENQASIYTLDPTSLGSTGNYTLEAGIYNQLGTVLYDSKTWNITINALIDPEFELPNPATTAVTFENIDTSGLFQINVENTDARSYNYNYYLDSNLITGSSGSASTTSATHQTIIAPNNLSNGLHQLEIQLTDSLGNVFDSYVWSILITEPDLPEISFTTPSFAESINIVDQISFDSVTSTSSGYRDITLAGIDEICVTVDDYDKEVETVSDIDIEFSIDGVTQGSRAVFSANEYCHTSFDTFTLANSEISEAKTLTATVYKTGSNTIVDLRQWNMNVRPQNFRPSITINSISTASGCSIDSTTSFTNCPMTQSVDDDQNNEYTDLVDENNSFDFAIEFPTDPDITTEEDYRVVFQLRKSSETSFIDLDQSASSVYSKSDCVHDESNASATKRVCSLNMDAFNDSGPLDPGSYVLQAYVEDLGGIDLGSGRLGSPLQSTSVTWQIDVSELQTTTKPIIADQSPEGDGGTGDLLSWIEKSDVSCSSTGTNVHDSSAALVSENEYIIVHAFVKDFERDDFQIQVDLENGETGSGAFTNLFPLQLVNRDDGSEYFEYISDCIQVPEWTVDGNLSSDSSVDLRISATDNPGTGTAVTSDSVTLKLLVDNQNPEPVMDNTTISLADKISIAGSPFTITAPAATDDSVIDGENITYQWQAYDDDISDWVSIEDATNSVLVWTPKLNTTQSTVDLRLCIGDDGGNAADCNESLRTKLYEDLQIRSSVSNVIDDLASSSQISSWFDGTSMLYTAYFDPTSEEIKVNKKEIIDGVLTDINTISFEPHLTNDYPNVYNLSITGTGKTLAIAYTTKETTGVANSYVRVRRIDLNDDLMAFHYGGFYTDDSNNSGWNIAHDLVEDEASFSRGTFNSLNGELLLVITGYDSGDNFSIIKSDRTSTAEINAGTLCSSCTDDSDGIDELGQAIEAYINSDSDLNKELLASFDITSNILTIKGPKALSYTDYNSTNIPLISNIVMDSENNWYLPFIDYTADSKISILSKDLDDTDMTGSTFTYLSQSGTSSSLRMVRAAIDSNDNLIVAAKNTNGFLELYTDELEGSLSSNSLENINGAPYFQDLSAESISTIDIKIGPNDQVYVASVSTDNKINLLVTENILANPIEAVGLNCVSGGTCTNSHYSNFEDDIAGVQIIPDLESENQMTLAIATSSDNTLANELHLVKAQLDSTTVASSSNISIVESSDTNYVSQKLNTDNILDLTNQIIATPAYSLTNGHIDDTSGVVEDSEKQTSFIGFIEYDDPSYDIKQVRANIESEDISTNTSTNVSSSALIKN